MKVRNLIIYIILAVIALSLIPLSGMRYLIFLFSKIMILAIAALAWNLLFGYTGLLSFGHGAFFGVGAYTLAILISKYSVYSIEVTFPIALLVSAVIGAAIGGLCIRYVFKYFALLTLAFGQFFYAIIFKLWEWTGGSDGLHVPRPTFLGFKFTDVNYYYFVLSIFIICVVLMWIIANSPFGKILQAIRESSVRTEFLGIPVKRYKWIIFTISATFTGVAGALYAPLVGHVAPDLLHWGFSGEIMLIALLGGYKFFLGPIIGSFIFNYLRTLITTYTIYWLLFLGSILTIIVLVFPSGIMGGIDALRKALVRFSHVRG